MNSPISLSANRLDQAPSDAFDDSARQRVVQLPETGEELTGHNGRPGAPLNIEPLQADDFWSPLRALAVGTACLLATMAAVIAFG